MVVLVTGGNGQLGQALQYIAGKYTDLHFHFTESTEGDITDSNGLPTLFERTKPNYVINAAAYTAVDKAEAEPEQAKSINTFGARNLAAACKQFHATLIHISTDFIFDGTKTVPYTEADAANPQSVYGKTKCEGETAIRDILERHFIIRTSWVYSQFGNNFMKTMLRLASERDSLSVVSDQIGTPTHAVDLAEAIIQIINFLMPHPEPDSLHLYGTYNFSNGGQCSWYEFAKEIFAVNNVEVAVRPISTAEFPTAATRPKYSVLDKSKIVDKFGIEIADWRISLKKHS